jgi:hypothetical protein
MSPKKQIPELEKNSNWQATAQYKNGTETAIMRGVPHGPFAGKFYLYDEDAPLSPAPDTPYSAEEIQQMFASGELSLLHGKTP